MALMSNYPATLPAPHSLEMTPRERRSRSTLPGNTATRNLSRERILDAQAQWIYSAEQMATWRTWFDDTLHLGLRMFRMSLPGAGGWVDRVVRYRPSTMRLEHRARGIYALQIQLEITGRINPAEPASLDFAFDARPWVELVLNPTLAATGSLDLAFEGQPFVVET